MIRELAPEETLFGPSDRSMRVAALDAFDMALLPMLDGIVLQDAQNIPHAFIEAFTCPKRRATELELGLSR